MLYQRQRSCNGDKRRGVNEALFVILATNIITVSVFLNAEKDTYKRCFYNVLFREQNILIRKLVSKYILVVYITVMLPAVSIPLR